MAIFDIEECERKIGYVFKDKMLLRQCFTHASYAYENGGDNNELLEFFGDSIMEFIVTEYLYKECKCDEGRLTKIRAEIVSKTPLQKAVERLGLSEFLLLGNDQKKSVSKDDKMFSSIYEALVAGIYLDGGIRPVKKFILETLIKFYKESKTNKKAPVNKGAFKVAVQEHVQKCKLGSISYQALGKKGPDHMPEFREAILLNGDMIAEGKGRSRQEAQNKAAEKALKKIKNR